MIYPIIIHEQHKGFIYPVERDLLVVRLKAERDSIRYSTLLYCDSIVSQKTLFKRLEMSCYARDNMFDYFECRLKAEKVICYLNYYFEICNGNDVFWMNFHGIVNSTPSSGFFKHQYSNEGDIFRIPQWVNEAVVYQIFPERFCNGDFSNDPADIKKWGSEPTRMNFMGGDLRGIIEKVNYLKNLGINTLYLNPVFESPSNHKYDTADYYTVDRHFGGLDDLKELVAEYHRNGIKVILDGVFNHCGYNFKKFQDVIKNGKKSAYFNWFYIDGDAINSEQINYECFGYYDRMPKLRFDNPEVRDYFLGVGRYWIEEADIDGWRLDVADEVDYTFWQEFRRLIKKIKPDCFLMAETWKENLDMLRGDQFDSVMNYLFRDAVVDFFGRVAISSFEFDAMINRFIGVYSKQAAGSLLSLIGSHDTERFLSICGEVQRMKAAIAFQFCFIGVPSIYYGDEVGILGENDPGCRKCMEWDTNRQNLDLHSYYRKLIEIRKSIKVFTNGDFKSNYCSNDNNVYGFFRFSGAERAYVVINNSDTHASIRLPVLENYGETERLKDIFSDNLYFIKVPLDNDFFYNFIVNVYNGVISLELDPYQVCILIKQ